MRSSKPGGRKVDGPYDLRYGNDRAGRLTDIDEQVGFTSRPLKDFTYATVNGTGDLRKGQLQIADRYNYADFNGNAVTVRLQESYVYGGLAGAVSRRDTQMWVNGGAQESFTQAFSWRDIGNLNYLDYPECTHAGCATPSPRRVQFNFDSDHREYLSSIRDLTTAAFYVTDFTYHPNGLPSTTTHANGVTDHQTLDSAMARPERLWTTGANSNWNSGDFIYDGAGNLSAIGSHRYQYDGVSRLTRAQLGTAQSGGGNHLTRTYSYDAFGNLQQIGNLNLPEDSATNRLAGGNTYDAAGNMLSWNGTVFEYDALGMVTQRAAPNQSPYYFVYTADDERLWTFHTSGSRWTLRDLAGKVLRDYRSGGGTWSVERDYIYANGKLLAATDGTTTYHYHSDHLGTPRLITNQNGTKLAYHAYYPFGEEATFWNQDSERMKFTGHERDLYASGEEDDLDYQHARYYSQGLGRFLSTDPVDSAVFTTPQTLNEYAYVANSPLKYTDPTGEVINLAAAGAGAAIGGLAGAAGSVIAQLASGDSINWQDVGAASLGGAVSGGLAGLTLGTSLVVEAGGVVAVAAATNVIGGAVTRELDSDGDSSGLDPTAMAIDAASGAIGGALAGKVDASFSSKASAGESQAKSSAQAAMKGNYGASQAVKGNLAKAARLRSTGEVAATVVGAKTTNVVVPTVEAVGEKNKCQSESIDCQ